jgi:PIN domain nuclease of toxin-antitoxin system
MKLLLDTHIFVWALAEPRKLATDVQRLILSPRNEIYVSAVTLLEISVKRAGGRRSGPPLRADEAWRLGQVAGYRYLEVRPEHAIAVEDLPLVHGDPHDRLLVVQAKLEGMRLVTHDETLRGYGEHVMVF